MIASVANQSQGCFVAVAPDHSVYVAYFRGNAPNQIFIRRSTDGGVTFGTEHLVATLNTTSVNGGLNLNGGLRTNSFPHMAVNPVSGAIVVVYNDDDVPGNADNGDIFYARSTNLGATWSAPVKVNDDGPRDQFTPTTSPTGEQVAFGYYSRSHDPANQMFHGAPHGDDEHGHGGDRDAAQRPDLPGHARRNRAGPGRQRGVYGRLRPDRGHERELLQHVVRQPGRQLVHAFQPDVQIARVARDAPNTATDAG